jgi:hypothetical protein
LAQLRPPEGHGHPETNPTYSESKMFVALFRHLCDQHNFSRKHATIGARIALGLDTFDYLPIAGFYHSGRRVTCMFREKDIEEIRKAVQIANTLI